MAQILYRRYVLSRTWYFESGNRQEVSNDGSMYYDVNNEGWCELGTNGDNSEPYWWRYGKDNRGSNYSSYSGGSDDGAASSAASQPIASSNTKPAREKNPQTKTVALLFFAAIFLSFPIALVTWGIIGTPIMHVLGPGNAVFAALLLWAVIFVALFVVLKLSIVDKKDLFK